MKPPRRKPVLGEDYFSREEYLEVLEKRRDEDEEYGCELDHQRRDDELMRGR